MRLLMPVLAACFVLFSSQLVFADAPDISYNVTMITNATAAQCPSSMRGDADPATDVDLSGLGSQVLEGPGVESCTGCAIDASNNCVCSKCYSFYPGR